MKKIVALLLATVMVFLLVACGSTKKDDDIKQDDPIQTKEVSRGSIEGDVYTSEFLGLSFTKPESWVYSTDEEIAAAMNLGVDIFLGENFKDAVENNPSLFDMMAVDIITRSNINIVFENLSKTFATNITVEQYIQALKAQLANLSGMKVTFPEAFETVKLGETEFTKVDCTVTVQGSSMKQIYYLNKVDKFMRSVIVTIPSGYTAEQIEAMFQ